jgi:hypothetical protein
MPDIGELLAAEAVRLQPAHERAFADLVKAQAKRHQRHRVAAGVALVIVMGAGGGSAVLGSGHEPTTPRRPGPARAPLGAVSPTGPTVMVTGVLQWIGGRYGMTPHGIAGMVHFHASDGTVIDVVSENDGRFTIGVPVGTYLVAGTPAQSSGLPCQAEAPVVVPESGLSGVRVNCHIR